MIKTIGWLQLLIWVVVVPAVMYLLFISNSPRWYDAIKIGLEAQFFLLITTSLIKRKLNISWFILDIFLLCIIGFEEFRSRNIIDVKMFKGENGFWAVYAFIFIQLCGYLYSLWFILIDLKREKTT